MKAAIAAKPYRVELNPLLIFSAPSCGPIVRSSMISIGAANEPARNSKAKSVAAAGVSMPVI